MSKGRILFVGDTHASHKDLHRAMKFAWHSVGAFDAVVQVGDFGLGFGMEGFKPKKKVPVYALRGNHDNPESFKAGDPAGHVIYMQDGEVYEIAGWRCLVMGGATSIDQAYRRAYVSWWPGECIQISDAHKGMEQTGIEVMLTHDCPNEIFQEVATRLPGGDRYSDVFPAIRSDRGILSALLEQHKPKVWVFGHYHLAMTGTVNETFWAACPAGDQYHLPLWFLDSDGLLKGILPQN